MILVPFNSLFSHGKTNKMMKKITILFTFLCSILILEANEIWTKVSKEQLKSYKKVNRSSFPNKAEYFLLDIEALKIKLGNAPERFVQNTSDLIIEFPDSEGKLEKFKVVSSPIMHADLAAKYPMIKTYAAQGIDDPTAFMRFSITQFGLHTLCLSGIKSTSYIDPFTVNDNYYIVYNKQSLGIDAQGFECLVDDNAHLPSIENDRSSTGLPKAINDQKFRIFRLAQSCTAEYGNIFANTSGTELADIQAQMTITVNRVNTVYEIDLGIQLQFIANNDLLIYFGNTNNDPWDGEWNTTTAQTIDAAVGVSNYDIGHNFNAQGGGNAGCIGCVCLSQSQTGTHKGRGYTGRSNPTGDPFDIDYVAHEMGHQFGGYHTQSNQSCRSGSGQTEVEPGSGSSIMGYAGICADNVQGNSDAHFNYVNIRDISANIKAGGNSTCANEISTTNNPPTANAGADYVIPKSTAFILEGTATDVDGMASLTYNWSQNDPENPSTNNSPVSTRTLGPMYRSILPTISPNRYMPDIAQVLNGNLTPSWEVTPSVGRTMEFAFTVRDNELNGAQTADDLMEVVVSGTAGPFEVTSQNSPQNWVAGTAQTITWNVAGTTTGSVNTPSVDIFLSLDDGFTYPISLATNVPNDGSQSVNIPGNSATSSARIMVRGHNNIFYALNGANIVIAPGDFYLDFDNLSVTTCFPDDAVYSFTYNPINGFSQSTNFSVNGLPTGVTATFNPTSANASTNISLTLSGITAANQGFYNLTLSANATSSNQTQDLNLEIAGLPNSPNLSLPPNNTSGIAVDTDFSWQAVLGNSVSYNIEISTDAAFTNIVESANGLSSNLYTASNLNAGTQYFWRVKTINPCSESSFSSVFNFTSSTCFVIESNDVPISISNFGTPTITSTIEVTTAGAISDVNVLNIFGDHTRVGNLVVRLTSPSGTTVDLWSNICGFQNDFDLNFDDAAASSNIPCPPTGGGTFKADDLLADFNLENALGTWTLTIEDQSQGGGGDLLGWSLEICMDPSICPAPEMPVITASSNNFCSGISASLSVTSGNLNAAAYWQWYSGACGGTMLGTGPNLTIAPSSTTTYFVRGEGACVYAPENCAEETIQVIDLVIIDETITAFDSALVNGTWYYTSDFIVETYTAANGCDSISRINLVIEYKEPNNVFSFDDNENLISLFPNPNKGAFTLTVNFDIENENEILIYNMLGQVVYKLNNIDKASHFIQLNNESKGIYHLLYKSESKIIKKDIVVY